MLVKKRKEIEEKKKALHTTTISVLFSRQRRRLKPITIKWMAPVALSGPPMRVDFRLGVSCRIQPTHVITTSYVSETEIKHIC